MILIFLDDAQWVKVECCTLESISYYSISVKWSRSELEDGRRPSSSELFKNSKNLNLPPHEFYTERYDLVTVWEGP